MMNYKNGRVCFWTTAVQNALILQYAEYYGCSRSYAVSLIVRRYMANEMLTGTSLGDKLQTAYDTLMSNPRRATSELASQVVDKGMDRNGSDDVPW